LEEEKGRGGGRGREKLQFRRYTRFFRERVEKTTRKKDCWVEATSIARGGGVTANYPE